MKKPIVYTLVFLMFIAVNFQSVCYLMYVSGHSLELAPNFLSEEERHESEESSDDLKKKESDFLHSVNEHFVIVISSRPSGQYSELSFTTSNFSGKIFNPPEFSLI